MARANRIQIIKYAPPPPELPVYGSANPEEVSFIGRTNYVAALEEKKFIFGIKRADRRRHTYIIGKSGVGKSKLEELFVRQDIAYGHGLCVIDPHGELVEELLDFIPQERAADVCLIDPMDIAHPVAFNPFSNVDISLRSQFAQSFVEILARRFGSSWSARLEHVVRFMVVALLDYPEATIEGMLKLLVDDEYRARVHEHVTDEMVRKFWATEFTDWSKRYESDVIIPLVNILNQLVSDPLLHGIFSRTDNKVDFAKLIAEKKIVLISLARSRISEENASFLGMLFLLKLRQVGMVRALSRDAKDDFYIYLDSFEMFASDSFDHFLSDARKYGFVLTMAHQYFAQISKKVQNAILGTVGTLIVFRVGGDDAVALKPEFAPVFETKDMINLGIGEFYIKMTIDGESCDPFSAETLKVLPPPYASSREKVITSSWELYS